MDDNSRRDFIKKATLLASALSLGRINMNAASTESTRLLANNIEWRNKQPEMGYRKLGNTGLMISEMVIGGGGLNPDRYKFISTAIERGVNYIDTASRYGKGKSELGVAEVIKDHGREKLFVATKISEYLAFIDQLSADIFKGLPSTKQEALREQAAKLIELRSVNKSGYYYKYFPTQDAEFPDGYLTYVIRKEYAYQNKWKKQIKNELKKALDESLKRLGTDYVDILHCPHGVRVPEELEDEAILETFAEFKAQGKIRFSGVSIHSDVPRNLEKAAELGHYDTAMVAYNIVNQASMEMPISKAHANGMGLVAMKAASSVYTPHEELKPVPQWRIDKLNKAIEQEMSLPLKAYLWVLQNPKISGVISDFKNEDMIKENLTLIGKKVVLKML